MSASAPFDYDVLIAGGGLRGSLIALMLAKFQPQARFLLIERAPQFGGGEIEPFWVSDVPPHLFEFVDGAIVRRWTHYHLAFPARNYEAAGDIAFAIPEQVHADVIESLDPASYRLGATVSRCGARDVVLSTGEQLRSRTVVDCRAAGAMPPAGTARRMASQVVRFQRPHPLDLPILIDATLESLTGSSFLQYIPLSPDTLEIRHICHAQGHSSTAFTLPDAVLEGGHVIRRGELFYALDAHPVPWIALNAADRPLIFDARAYSWDPILPSGLPAALLAAYAIAQANFLRPEQSYQALTSVVGAMRLKRRTSIRVADLSRQHMLEFLRDNYS